jgi:demethylmenaquinone methyltransferase/2-methoxy-6-polyprenyl-1,4-benzoquinol methylase
MKTTQVQDPNRFAQQLFTPLPSRYDRLAEVLSFGQNHRWRTEMVGHVVAQLPSLVLDVASGTAGVALQLADRSRARIVGVDLTPAMLGVGRDNVARRMLSGRVQLTAGRAEELPFADATFDGLTFTYLFRYVDDPLATLRELARVVRPGAPVASLEFGEPDNPFWWGAWWLYTRIVLPVAGLATGGKEWFEVGRFLGPSISSLYRRLPVAATVELWREAGFTDVSYRRMSLGGGLVMWGRRAGG